MKTDPCPYLVKYLNGVIKKKTKAIDIFNSDKKGVIKIVIKLNPQEIWTMVRNKYVISIYHGGLHSILILIIHFFSAFKVSKTFVLSLRTSVKS